MFTIAFILAVIAVALFLFEWYQTKSLVAAGLAVVTVAWILTQTLEEGGHVTF